MRAALLEGVEDSGVVDDVAIDEPHEGEVLVRGSHCGVCHSDLPFLDGRPPVHVPGAARPRGRRRRGARVFGVDPVVNRRPQAMVTALRPLEEIGDAFTGMKAGKGLLTVLEL